MALGKRGMGGAKLQPVGENCVVGSPEWQNALSQALQVFGHDTFRPGQQEAIEQLWQDRRLLLVAPTGGGKSLTYQLPALILQGVSLVVSPLIALMHDQVEALAGLGVAATYLASTLTAKESRERLRRIHRGEYQIIYVAPERLLLDGFLSMIAELKPPLVAIDEAHCISEWGHDFRPEYLRLGEIVPALPHARILACTATATPVVRDEILARLGLGPQTPQIIRGFARPNLALRAREIQGARERQSMVDGALEEALGSADAPRGSAIVYSPTRKLAEEEGARLAKLGFKVGVYHAGRDAISREHVLTQFRNKILDVVVATCAFGMGIDRGDVRAVVHLGPPGSLEAYYQEVGRAGRDGALALGLLLTGASDLPLRRQLLDRSVADGSLATPAREHKWELFLELMRWAEGGSCRHDAILRYFGDEAEALSGCGLCDMCVDLAAQNGETTTFKGMDIHEIVGKALSAVARLHGRFGMGMVVKLLLGTEDPRLTRCGVAATPTFGALAAVSERWLQRLLRRCVTAGWVGFFGESRPVVVLTEAGAQVLRGKRPAKLLLPTEVEAKAGALSRRRRADTKSLPPLSGVSQDIFTALREARLNLAKEEGVPPYVIASDRALRDIGEMRPRSHAELQLAHGIGASRAEKYGNTFLAIVAQAIAGKSIDSRKNVC